MRRENVLDGQWFIKFNRPETAGELVAEYRGRVVGEAADGWFYVEIFGTGWNVVERKVLPVAELASALFYRSELEFRDAPCSPKIQKKG